MTGRRRRAPDPQHAALGPGAQQGRNHTILEVIEWRLVAEKESLVRGHRLDHVVDQRFAAGLHLGDEIADTRDADLPRQRQQPALEQILLIGREHQAGSVLEYLLQIVVIERSHGLFPGSTGEAFLSFLTRQACRA